MTKVSPEQKLQHLMWRAGFGPTAHQLQKSHSIKQAVKTLLNESISVNPLKVAVPELYGAEFKMQSADQRKKNQMERRQAFEELNFAWLGQLASAKEQLREKMTLFWHGHFACRLRDPALAQLQHNTLRKYALGKFPDLLHAISKDPGMLQFLNNQQNKKQHPNENFAREVLELFTLGRGHYTEKDIKEAARAFTGWGFNLKGEFVFRERQHDRGSKIFMGQKGNFNGDDILNIIVKNPRTAEFITQKLYTYFVSDTPSPDRISALSKNFYKSGYDIASLLQEIFTSDWFYSSEVIGSKIKSPIELMVGLQRQFDITYANTRSALILQKVLGQILFQPPNVSGWPGGRNWIDSSTLAYRLRIGPALVQNAFLDITPKPDDDAEPFKPEERRKDGLKIASAQASLASLQGSIEKIGEKDLPKVLSSQLLQVHLKDNTIKMLEQVSGTAATRAEKIRLLTLCLLSLPEYQLC
jgi:uncharacterized protein (DUF1800 family)